MKKSHSKGNHFEFADPSAYLGKEGFGANDCVIRAFCQALDMTFEELVDDFINSPGRGGGRSDLKRRLKIDKRTGMLKNPEAFDGLSWADVPEKYLCRSTGLYKWCSWDDIPLDDFCEITGKKFKGIDFVVGCTNGKYDHATYVRDGKFHDLGPKYHDWMCYSFFAFRNGKSIHLKEDPDPTFDESSKYTKEDVSMKKINENTKVTLTFAQIKKLVKEATGSTYHDPESGLEFESKELRDITPVGYGDFQAQLDSACNPAYLYAPDEDAAGGVLTSDFFQEQYDLLFKVADMFDKSGEPALKESAASIRSLVKPYADKLKAYMADAPVRQRASDALKQKRREQYLKLRDEFKDEEI